MSKSWFAREAMMRKFKSPGAETKMSLLSTFLLEQPHYLFVPTPLPYLDDARADRCNGSAKRLRTELQAAIHLRALTFGSTEHYTEWVEFIEVWSAALAVRRPELWARLGGAPSGEAQRQVRCHVLLALEQLIIGSMRRHGRLPDAGRSVADDVEAVGRIEGLDIGARPLSMDLEPYCRADANTMLLQELGEYFETEPDAWPLAPHWHVKPRAHPRMAHREFDRLCDSAAKWLAVVAKAGLVAERMLMKASLNYVVSRWIPSPDVEAEPSGRPNRYRDASALQEAWHELAGPAHTAAGRAASGKAGHPSPTPLQSALAKRYERALADPGAEELSWDASEVEDVRRVLDQDLALPADSRLVTGQLLALYFLRVLYGALLVPPTHEDERNHSTRAKRLLRPIQELLARMADSPPCRHQGLARVIHPRMDAFIRKSYAEHLDSVSARVGFALPDAFQPHDHRRPLHTRTIGALVGETHEASFEAARRMALNMAAVVLDPVAAVDAELAYLPWHELLGMLKGFAHPWRPPDRPGAALSKRLAWPPLDRHDDGKVIYRYCRRMTEQHLRVRYRAAFNAVVPGPSPGQAAPCHIACSVCTVSSEGLR